MSDEALRRRVLDLLHRVPEFSAGEHWTPDEPYSAFGTFAQFLCRRIREGTTDEFLERAFAVPNAMTLSGNDDDLNLLQVGFLELLLDDEHCAKQAERWLNERAVIELLRVRRFWNGEPLD